jgi:hypothetical protein
MTCLGLLADYQNQQEQYHFVKRRKRRVLDSTFIKEKSESEKMELFKKREEEMRRRENRFLVGDCK